MSVLNMLMSAREAFASWRQRERDYADLMALDDRSLADIGIRRSQIRDICDGFYAPVQSAAPVPVRGRANLTSPKAV